MDNMAQVDHAMLVHSLHDWSNLPRSVRWRLQLGILAEPSIQQQDLTLDVLLQHNQSKISDLGEKFKELVAKHVEEDEELVEGDDSNNSGNGQDGGGNDGDTAANSKTPEIDPLTAMVMEEEARETRKAELYLKYRKERARRKRGLTTEARIIESESDEVDRASVSEVILGCLFVVFLPSFFLRGTLFSERFLFPFP